MDVGRRTVTRRHRPHRGRRAARLVRTRSDVRRAQSVPIRGRAERYRRRRRRLDGRSVRRVRRRVAGLGRVRARLSARDAGQTVPRDRSVFRRSAAAAAAARVRPNTHWLRADLLRIPPRSHPQRMELGTLTRNLSVASDDKLW